MDPSTSYCNHTNEILDYHTSEYICCDCGLVKDKYYNYDLNTFNENFSKISKEEKIFVDDLLEKLNITEGNISKYIYEKICKEKKQNPLKKIFMPSIIYESLDELNINIPINDLSFLSNVSSKKIFKNQKKPIINTAFNNLESYCKNLNLTYKDYSLIKEKLPAIILTGHNPLTILGGVIYMYSKENKLKIDLKDISKTLNVSIISIKRYLKNIK